MEEESKKGNSTELQSPMQRQSFITTIKSVTEGKKLKSLIRFHIANKIDNYNRGEKKGIKKEKNSKESTEQVTT